MKSGRSLNLSAEAVREFREAASSVSLREDMQKARQRRKERERSRPVDADDFLEFLTFFSNLCSDAPLKLRTLKETFMVL